RDRRRGARPRGRRRCAGRKGARHAARAPAARARSASPGERSHPRRGGQQRRPPLGRHLFLQPLLRRLLRAGVLAPAGGLGMSRNARRMLLALQALVLGLPLFLGGRQTLAGASASLVVLGLLAVTLRERRRVGAALRGALARVQQVASNGDVLWITGIPTASGRASGPFVNPNHFAGWLEMIVPLGLVYAWSVARRVRRHLVRSIEAGRGIGVRG